MGRGKSGTSGTRARNAEWKDGEGGYGVFKTDTARYDDEGRPYILRRVKGEDGKYYNVADYAAAGESFEVANERAVGRDWYQDMKDKGENYYYDKKGLRFAKDRTDKRDKEAGDALLAFDQYQNSSAATNGQLRSGEVSSAVATRARRMEAALDKSEIGVPVVVQRHANSALLGFDRQASVKDVQGMVGKVVVDQGFMSCVAHGGRHDFSAGNAATGMGAPKNNQVMYHIAVPKSKGAGGMVGTHSPMAREFILNRGAALKVVGAYESGAWFTAT